MSAPEVLKDLAQVIKDFVAKVQEVKKNAPAK